MSNNVTATQTFFSGAISTVKVSFTKLKERGSRLIGVARKHKTMSIALAAVVVGSVVSNLLAFVLTYVILCFVGFKFIEYFNELSHA